MKRDMSGSSKPIILSTAAMFAVLVASLAWFLYSVQASMDKEAVTSLASSATFGARYIKHHICDLSNSVKADAIFIGRYDDMFSDETVGVLRQATLSPKDERYSVITTAGIARSTDGFFADVSDTEYFKRAMRGVTVSFAVSDSRYVHGLVFIIAVPIVRNGRARGVLVRSFYGSRIDDIFDIPAYDASGSFYIVENNGDVIVYPKGQLLGTYNDHSNVFDVTSKEESARSKSKEAIKKDMKDGMSGVFRFTYNGSAQLMYYAPIDINGWYIMSVVPYNALAFRYSGFTRAGKISLLLVAFFSLLIMVSVVRASRKMQEALMVSDERYRVIMENADEYIFDWDRRKNSVYCSPRYLQRFGGTFSSDTLLDDILNNVNIHPDDMERYRGFVSGVAKGSIAEGATEVRFKPLKGDYLWFEIHVSSIIGRDGKAKRVFAVVKNIDSVVKERVALKHQAQTDSLTGLYDKGTTRELISEYITGAANGKEAALFVIDIDNFKDINDKYGHLFGDIVLTEFGGTLKDVFRDSDVTGRIGGDEFMVFMKDIDGLDIVRRKVQELSDVFVGNLSGRDGMRDKPLIGHSVGISIFPRDGADFETLYKKADQALYSVKESGKKSCLIYDEHEAGIVNEAEITNARTEFDFPEINQRQRSFKDNMCEYILKMFYTAKDYNETIRLALGIVCRYYRTSRCYLVEYDRDENTATCAFEWCRQGVGPSIQQYNHSAIPAELAPDVRFAHSDTFYLKSPDEAIDPEYGMILRKAGIKSMFQCAFSENGQVVGFLGFDECTMEDRPLPTEEDSEMLRMFADTFAFFLLGVRAREREEQSKEIFKVLLQDSSRWLYAIDAKTFKFTNMNGVLRQYLKETSSGRLCYEAFMGLSAPCPGCPVLYMKEHGLVRYDLVRRLRSDGMLARLNCALMKMDDGTEVCLIFVTDLANVIAELKNIE